MDLSRASISSSSLMASFRKPSSAKVVTIQTSPVGAPSHSPGSKSGDPVNDVFSNEHVFSHLLTAPENTIDEYFPFYHFWVTVACSGPVITLGCAASAWTCITEMWSVKLSQGAYATGGS
jgi:hypothetical protein